MGSLQAAPAQARPLSGQPAPSGPLPSALQLLLGFLEALGLSKPHLAGFSLGGCIALKLAADHPEAVGKVGCDAAASAARSPLRAAL